MEYILYARRAGQPDYMEQIMTVTTNRERITEVQRMATEDGWTHFRIATYKGETPDFAGCVNI